jgi:hypothetical protein
MTKLTIRDAAYLAGRSERWIRNQIKDGVLPATKEPMGELFVYIIDSEDLNNWVHRPKSPTGKAAGDNPRARYVVSVPYSPQLEVMLIDLVSKVPESILSRGSQVLVDTRQEGGAY